MRDQNPSSRAADDTQAIQVLDEIALAHPLAKGDMVFAIMRNRARPPIWSTFSFDDRHS